MISQKGAGQAKGVSNRGNDGWSSTEELANTSLGFGSTYFSQKEIKGPNYFAFIMSNLVDGVEMVQRTSFHYLGR